MYTNAQRHHWFIESKEFAAELKGIPFRWRKGVIKSALEKMSWASHWKVYSGIAIDAVRGFRKQFVPEGVDLSQDDGDICATAEKAVKHVSTALWRATSEDHAMQIIEGQCKEYGIEPPAFDAFSDIVSRAICAKWWRRQLRKAIGRTYEAGAIRLGYVHHRAEPYASNESVLARIAQNRRNALAMEATQIENEFGQRFSIAEIAAKTTANKAIRRGELMTRINGFETLAKDAGDEGIFVTWTCPSRFHPVIKGTGKTNPKHEQAGFPTPKDANDYLCNVTALCRAALARRGIGLYGFRIAEPHHDGCAHWHLLLFVRPNERFDTKHIKDVAGRAIRIMKRYAWAEDRGEPGAFRYRLNVKRIDWSRGTAAGYIAKYVAKNIDGEHVGDHKTTDGTVVAPEYVGDVELQPSQRVEAWAARWGIRQFQQWGGAPVTVWRELRRVDASEVVDAEGPMLQAFQAVQKVEGEKRADWAEYLRAQGGPIVARCDLQITLAKNETKVTGRYGEAVRVMPIGVKADGIIYISTRYQWTPVKREGVASAMPAILPPRTRVNNCTQDNEPESIEYLIFDIPEFCDIPVFPEFPQGFPENGYQMGNTAPIH
jgi:hypothetical protein